MQMRGFFMQFYTMALKVGITGGIGSGKTLVCNVFALLGVPVYFADEQAKYILQNDTDVISAVKHLLGNKSYTSEGLLNRKYIASIVFADTELLKKYNAIIHPAVFDHAHRWMQAHAHYAYILKEAALLFESGSYRELDKIICVTAPEKLRMERVMQRDNISAEEVVQRMQNQWPEEQKISRSDYIIYNDGSQMLIPQVMEIHRSLLNLLS